MYDDRYRREYEHGESCKEHDECETELNGVVERGRGDDGSGAGKVLRLIGNIAKDIDSGFSRAGSSVLGGRNVQWGARGVVIRKSVLSDGGTRDNRVEWNDVRVVGAIIFVGVDAGHGGHGGLRVEQKKV